MTIESERINALDEHDQLVAGCAAGDTDFWDFRVQTQRSLDGHALDAARLAILAKRARRVASHREVWEQVLTKVTRDEFARAHNVKSLGFITARDAQERLTQLAEKFLRSSPAPVPVATR